MTCSLVLGEMAFRGALGFQPYHITRHGRASVWVPGARGPLDSRLTSFHSLECATLPHLQAFAHAALRPVILSHNSFPSVLQASGHMSAPTGNLPTSLLNRELCAVPHHPLGPAPLHSRDCLVVTPYLLSSLRGRPGGL